MTRLTERRLSQAGIAGSTTAVSTAQIRTRCSLLVTLAYVTAFAMPACQKSIAQDPPCPPGVLCDEPLEMWPVVAPIGVGVMAIAIVVVFILRPLNSRPLFVPYGRSLLITGAFGAGAAILFAVTPNFDYPLLGWPALGLTVAAFVLGGTSLRPRGSRARGLALGTLTYLISGMVSVWIINSGFEELDLLGFSLQVAAWPGLLLLILGGFVG